jgi:bifunctional non-homologous end joining protein LigD
MTLSEYRRKRDFKRTGEPPAKKAASKGPLTFVVQKHRARALHYDFRLELDGVLKSWSVPKGPSLDPADKRLAVMVEDHPIDYASFEGAIPKGEYGAGEVIIWDSGTYSPDEGGELLFNDRAAAEKKIRQGLKNGKLSIFLRGSKLKGSWTLVKIAKRERDWLLIKHRDEHARAGEDILKKEKSAASGRTIEDIKNKGGDDPPPTAPADLKAIPGARKAPFPATIAPMLASLTGGPFSRPDWIYEPKLDGFRIITLIRGGKAVLLSRNGNNVTAKYSILVPELSRQPASELVLDGEIIALDDKGKQCFQCLQNYIKSVGRKDGAEAGGFPLVYYVFDILYLDGFDLRGAVLRYRKELLKKVFSPGQQVRLIEYFEKDGETVYKAAVKNGLEGVVAKQIDSLYLSGKRSPDWLKVKATLSDEFVIGGYSVAPEGARKTTFSSLLLGYYDKKGKLTFAGHVGTGFDERLLGEMKKRLDTLQSKTNPFIEVPPLNAATTWVKPELVAEVKFSEWTRDGRLRAPVFMRLREDKSPQEVRRTETVVVEKPVKKTGRSRQADPPGDDPPLDSGKSDSVLAQLKNPGNDFTIEVEGHKINLSNTDKILWSGRGRLPGFTKRDLLEYLVRAAPYLLTHLKDRPLTLSRYPDGLEGEHFWQKHWGHPLPDFIRRIDIKEEKGTRSEYLICENLATLLWLGQVANLEFHSWFSRASAVPEMPKGKSTDYYLDYPDFIIFDLDPYIYSGKERRGDEPELNRAGFDRAGEIAFLLKEILDELGLDAYIKTSGKTGLHIHVPIKRNLTYASVRATAKTLGQYLVQRHPEDVTTEWAQEKRRGKIFVDYAQNVRGKTLASAYSPRPASGAPVSTPLRWTELGKVYPTDFNLKTVPERLKKTGDLWADILKAKKDLGRITGPKGLTGASRGSD